MTRLAGSAISRATTALLDADVTLAESVIAADIEPTPCASTSTRPPSTCSPASSRWRPTCGWS